MDRLYRTRLLFGDNGAEKLQKSTVMVVGCGAVGSVAIEALARTGVGNIIVVDFDVVEESNINRQLFALNSTIGRLKVDVARQRIFDINPDANVYALNLFWDKNTDLELVPDYIIDAIDSVESKVALYKWANERNIQFISCMGAASKIDGSKIKIAKISQTTVCPLASRIRRMVRDEKICDFPVVYSIETPQPVLGHAKNLGSVITVTGVFGLCLANWVVQEIINKK